MQVRELGSLCAGINRHDDLRIETSSPTGGFQCNGRSARCVTASADSPNATGSGEGKGKRQSFRAEPEPHATDQPAVGSAECCGAGPDGLGSAGRGYGAAQKAGSAVPGPKPAGLAWLLLLVLGTGGRQARRASHRTGEAPGGARYFHRIENAAGAR